MTMISVRVVDHGVGLLLRHMTIRHPGVVSRALNRTAFDVREAEAVMTARAFDFWSSVTKSFMANERSFPFDLSSRSKLEARVYAGTRSSGKRSANLRDIFMRQEFGFTLRPRERERLTLGKNPASYAVPTKNPATHLRNPRARVRASDSPASLLGARGGGLARFKPRQRRRKGVGRLSTHVFITPNDRAIIQVTPSGGRQLLYGLYSRDIPVEEHLDFFDTASRVVRARLIP